MAKNARGWLTVGAGAAALLGWASTTRAEPPAASASAVPPSKAPSTEAPASAVEVVTAPTSAAFDPAPPPVGGAAMSWRLVGADDAGTWAVRPGPFARFDPQIALVGGEIRLDPRLSVLLYGANEFMLHRFSGMMAGLMLRPLPSSALLQPTLSLGYSEDLGRSQAVWARLGATLALGPWRLGYALRGAAALGDDPTTQPALVGSMAVAYEQRRYSLGFEALREWRPGLPGRTVFAPSVSVRPTEKSEVRVSSGVSPQGASSPFKASFASRFLAGVDPEHARLGRVPLGLVAIVSDRYGRSRARAASRCPACRP